MVMENADALIAAPEIVIITAVEEVALQIAVKFGTLLEPAAAVGVTAEAKKLEGNVRVIVLPDEMETEGEKTRVLGTAALPVSRLEEAILKVEKYMLHPDDAEAVSQSLLAKILATATGVSRFVPEVPSPTCRNQLVSSTMSPHAHPDPLASKRPQLLRHCNSHPNTRPPHCLEPHTNATANHT